MRLIDKILETFREPVIPAGLPTLPIHALLHHHPLRIIRDNEPMQIKIEPVLHCRTVHLGHQSARLGQGCAVKPHAFPD